MTVTETAPTHHPVVVAHQQSRAADVRSESPDAVTKFAVR